jgi:hypothetical protein
MSDTDAVDALLRETEDLFNDSPRRTAPTRSVMGDRGGGVVDNPEVSYKCKNYISNQSGVHKEMV